MATVLLTDTKPMNLGALHQEPVAEWETRTVREAIARGVCKPDNPCLDLEENRKWHADGHLPKVE